MLLDGRKYQIGASIGMAMSPSDAMDADNLIVLADAAMYQAKKLGGNVSVVYASLAAQVA